LQHALKDLGKRVRQKAGLNRCILDQGWAEFRRQLAYRQKARPALYHTARGRSAFDAPAARNLTQEVAQLRSVRAAAP